MDYAIKIIDRKNVKDLFFLLPRVKEMIISSFSDR